MLVCSFIVLHAGSPLTNYEWQALPRKYLYKVLKYRCMLIRVVKCNRHFLRFNVDRRYLCDVADVKKVLQGSENICRVRTKPRLAPGEECCSHPSRSVVGLISGCQSCLRQECFSFSQVKTLKAPTSFHPSSPVGFPICIQSFSASPKLERK